MPNKASRPAIVEAALEKKKNVPINYISLENLD